MTNAPTATRVLDGFEAARAVMASGEPMDRTREVIGWLRTYVEDRGAVVIDDLTAHRLVREVGRTPTEHELAAVLSVIEHVTGFFEHLSAGSADSSDLADAADVVRDLATWLTERGLVDHEVGVHLERYTHLYDDDQRTGT
jgi:hypothetical protein